jgi:hypothetical protein
MCLFHFENSVSETMCLNILLVYKNTCILHVRIHDRHRNFCFVLWVLLEDPCLVASYRFFFKMTQRNLFSIRFANICFLFGLMDPPHQCEVHLLFFCQYLCAF